MTARRSWGWVAPRGFYLRYGFIDTGRMMWGENVLALDLAGRRQTVAR